MLLHPLPLVSLLVLLNLVYRSNQAREVAVGNGGSLEAGCVWAADREDPGKALNIKWFYNEEQVYSSSDTEFTIYACNDKSVQLSCGIGKIKIKSAVYGWNPKQHPNQKCSKATGPAETCEEPVTSDIKPLCLRKERCGFKIEHRSSKNKILIWTNGKPEVKKLKNRCYDFQKATPYTTVNYLCSTTDCQDKDIWGCTKIKEMGGCSKNSNFYKVAKEDCRRTCEICISGTKSGWKEATINAKNEIPLYRSIISLRLVGGSHKQRLEYSMSPVLDNKRYHISWVFHLKYSMKDDPMVDLKFEDCGLAKSLFSAKSCKLESYWTIKIDNGKFSFLCDEVYVVQEISFPSRCMFWREGIKKSKWLAFSGGGNQAKGKDTLQKLEYRVQKPSPYTVENIVYKDNNNLMYRSWIKWSEAPLTANKKKLRCVFWDSDSSTELYQREITIIVKPNDGFGWQAHEFADHGCSLQCASVEGNLVCKCPGTPLTDLFVKQATEDTCVFSKICPGLTTRDVAMQACGCPNIQLTGRGQLNTTICMNQQGQYQALPTSKVCSTDKSICLGWKKSVESATGTLCADPNSLYECSDGRLIPRKLLCNYKDDCGTVAMTVGTWLSLYEDEADSSCNHESGVTCSYLMDTPQGARSINIWVPPYQLCKKKGICEDLSDAESNRNKCKESFSCTLDKKTKTVFKGQMCDPTIPRYKHCDDMDLPYINCTIDSLKKSVQPLRCLVNGYESVINERLECDGKNTCDGGEDEVCFISKSNQQICTANKIRVGKSNCVDTKDEFVTCPESGYYINKDLICDSKTDCSRSLSKQSNEEGKCTKYNRMQTVKRLNFDETEFYFEPKCKPGLAKESLRCQAKLFYYKESYDCENGDTDCQITYLKETCLIQDNTMLKCAKTSHSSVSEIEPTEAIVLVTTEDSSLTGFKDCVSSKQPIKVTKWCDTQYDCDDHSDENNCSGANPRTFDCGGNSSKRYIPYSQVCNDITDCPDNHLDECNDECPNDSSRNILTDKYRPVAGCIGVSALLVNVLSLVKNSKELLGMTAGSGYINQSLVTMIALGDSMIGIYMILVLIATLQFGRNYCRVRWEWLSSWQCSTLGVLSTTGTLISMISMTVLSVFRMHSLRSMVGLGDVTAKMRIKVGLACLGITILSLLIACLPIMELLSSYFVNGLVVIKSPFFSDVAKRGNIKAVVNHFDPSIKIETKSWEDYQDAIKELYYLGPELEPPTTNSFEGTRLGFYGNQGVCLFKYFVRPDDPQLVFSILILGLSCVCFAVITFCYIYIFTYASSSMKNSGATDGSVSAMTKLQTKVTLIIATDFLTWIPFITIAILHCCRVLDGTEYYEFCSIVLTPINSVINPIIYNGDKATDLVKNLVSALRRKATEISRAPTVTVNIAADTQAETAI